MLCLEYDTSQREQNNSYFSKKKNLKIILNVQCFLYTINTKSNTYFWSFFFIENEKLLYLIRHLLLLLLFINFYFILKAFRHVTVSYH